MKNSYSTENKIIIIFVFIIILIIFTAQLFIPCEWFKFSAQKDIPGRCISSFNLK